MRTNSTGKSLGVCAFFTDIMFQYLLRMKVTLSHIPLFVGLTLLVLISTSCDKGNPLENIPPETSIFLTEINLEGQNRLNSIVRLYWSGEDVDGYVNGFDVSLDGQDWTFTTSTDSIFSFAIPFGVDSVDIPLFVRAVDNDNERDPSPATLTVPLKNRPPVALIDTVAVLPDTVFSAGTMLFSVADPDGDETLNGIEIKINDGPWYTLPITNRFVSFLPENPEQAGPQDLILYDGPSAIELSSRLEGAVVGAENRFYIRATDIAGISSALDSTTSFFLRQQNSDLLLVDDHGDSDADALHQEILNNVYPSYDVIDIRSNRPSIWDPTLGLILGIYDRVIWYSDGADLPSLGQQLTLEIAATSLQEYLNEGGKLFVSAKFPATFNDPTIAGQSSVFDFSPMDSLSSSDGQARIPRDSLLDPVGVLSGLIDPIVCGTFITGADPFYAKDPGNALLDAHLVGVGGWVGPTTIAARTTFTNGETNQIFVGVELHKLDGDRSALEGFLDWAMNSAFAW